MPRSQNRRERSSTIKNRKSCRKVTRTHLLEQLEDRRLLAVASPPDQPLYSLADSVLLSTGNFSPGNAADLVNVARDGQIAVTNNGNDNTWETAAQTVRSGEVLGGSTGLLGNDPFDDLVLQTGATIEILTSDGSGGWVAQQTVPYTGTTDVATHADTKPSLGFLNSDFALDFVAPLAQSNQVAIFLGSVPSYKH